MLITNRIKCNMHLLPPFLPIRWWVALSTVQKFGLEKHLGYYRNMKIREACWNMVRFDHQQCRPYNLYFTFSESKNDSGKCHVRMFLPTFQ